jgi:hypothetical protein
MNAQRKTPHGRGAGRRKRPKTETQTAFSYLKAAPDVKTVSPNDTCHASPTALGVMP